MNAWKPNTFVTQKTGVMQQIDFQVDNSKSYDKSIATAFGSRPSFFTNK